MKRLTKTCIVFAGLLLIAGNTAARAQSVQQTADQIKTDSNANKSAEKRSADGAPATKKNNSNDWPAAGISNAAPSHGGTAKPPSSTTAPTQKSSPGKNAAMVWVNTESGVYHKLGTRWYGRTKQGRYMTETDAIKAGYKASARS
ncbi:MAG TPA: hypothetical protein VJO16_18825 [Candidatus Acidoferrum sp.]|nr:hypothetical protein [Candidatus Acidoferrum sp.]